MAQGGHTMKPQGFDEDDYFPKVEENVDRKLYRFFDFTKKLKTQIRVMHQREVDGLQELHSDPKDKATNGEKKKYPKIIGVNFRAVNEIYDSRKPGAGKERAKSQNNAKKPGAG